MIESLTKIKSLLVASCDCCHQGNRDIAMNMLEIVLDEMSNLDPQDLEDGIKIVPVVDGSIEDSILESACFNDELEEESEETISEIEVSSLDDDTAKKSFNDMISKMLSTIPAN